jgi:hypothetical protein
MGKYVLAGAGLGAIIGIGIVVASGGSSPWSITYCINMYVVAPFFGAVFGALVSIIVFAFYEWWREP